MLRYDTTGWGYKNVREDSYHARTLRLSRASGFSSSRASGFSLSMD